MSDSSNNSNSTAYWLRELASYVDYSRFRRIWLQPITEQAEQGYIAACYEQVARRANSEGEYYLAYDAANHGLRAAVAGEFPPHRLTALKVTALARSGATSEARHVMDQFLESCEPDSSICSAQARLFRDLGLAAPESEDRRHFFNEAARWALQAMACTQEERGDWAYPANQEVQFRFLAGDHERARADALRVIELVEQRPDVGSMWNQTNLAEMHLVRGDLTTAGLHYKSAADLGINSPGDLAANRAVAAVLLRELSRCESAEVSVLESWFPKPVLLVFAGHMPDLPSRPTPRLPAALCGSGGIVEQALIAKIRHFQAVEGICASAPGGDILFAEALIASGARLSLVDPFPRSRIEKVATDYGEDWPGRLARIFRMAVGSESITCAEDADETAQCEYGNHVMIGSAMLRAGRINAKLYALVLWDEMDVASPKRGGTGQFVALCREAGVPVEIVNPTKLNSHAGGVP